MKNKLSGVPETLLWTLYNRATESKKSDGVIKDIKAEEIFDSIDFPYKEKFGKPSNLFHPIRSLIFDSEIEKFIAEHPEGVIVNLGEGLETHRFRVRPNNNLWYTVDLKEAIQIREEFISADDRHIHLACSALDPRWINNIDRSSPVLINAQGLLMYFQEEDVKKLIQNIADYFERAIIVFDIINKRFSEQTMRGYKITDNYMAPQMPWGMQRHDIQKTFPKWSKRIKKVDEIDMYFPRGLKKYFFIIGYKLPFIRDSMPVIVKLEIF
ncbi:MAG: class I SAM-dependent methyltransferase [Tissierellia bacterium]|nr:class I SAM-dependent methyltransferase [Tissierellia bacterium]